MSLKGTRTEKNILTAFAGESQARNRYSYFSAQAKKEGYAPQKTAKPLPSEEKRTGCRRP